MKAVPLGPPNSPDSNRVELWLSQVQSRDSSADRESRFPFRRPANSSLTIPGRGGDRFWGERAGRESQRLSLSRQEIRLNQSVRRAAGILRACHVRGGDTASGLARRTGLPWATCFRLIRTLEHEGFLLRLPNDRYVPGPALVGLTAGQGWPTLLIGIAEGELERLVAEVGEAVNLAVVHPGGQLEVVGQFDPPRLLHSANYIGRWYPEHASAMGKLMLAEYDEDRLAAHLPERLERFGPATLVQTEDLRAELTLIRERGYATAVDELEEGLAAVSVGVRGSDDLLLGIVGVSGPSSRFDERKRELALPYVRATVARIEQALAG
jgi:DNA-binding IclR family transcriptional regulator